jgi:hypothetical protein
LACTPEENVNVTVSRPWPIQQRKQIVVVDLGLLGRLQHCRPRKTGPRHSSFNGFVCCLIDDPI